MHFAGVLIHSYLAKKDTYSEGRSISESTQMEMDQFLNGQKVYGLQKSHDVNASAGTPNLNVAFQFKVTYMWIAKQGLLDWEINNNKAEEKRRRYQSVGD